MQTQDNRHTPERTILNALIISGFAATLGVGLFSFTIPLMSLDEKISGAWLGTAFAGYFFAKLLISPVAGIASDKFGPKKLLISAALIGSVAPLTYFVLPSLAALYAIQFTLGLVSGLIRPVGMATLGGSVPSDKLTPWFALHAAAFNAAIFAGPLLGGILYFNRSMALPLIGLSICMGASALFVHLLLPADAKTKQKKVESQTTSQSKSDIFPLLLAIGGRTLGIGLLAAFYPILIKTTLGQSGLIVAVIYALPGLTTSLALPMTGRLFKENSARYTMFIGMIISAASLFALGLCEETWQFLACGALMGLGAAISIPASMTQTSEVSRQQGAVFGAANVAAGIGFLLGPLLGGIIIQNFNATAPALQLAAIIGALSSLPLLAHTMQQSHYWSKSMTWTAIAACSILLVLMGFLHLRSNLDANDLGDDNLYEFSDVAMGTIVTLTLEAESQKAASDAARKVIASMRALQQDYDHRNPNGSIGRINNAAGQQWVTPTPRAFELLKRTLDFSAQTNGVFDPTIGALTTSPLYYALDETIADAKKGLVDHKLVQIDTVNKRIRLDKHGMALDLGGVAKGTIIDTAVRLLRKLNITAGIVEAGGDFYCFGDRDWTIGVRHPRAEEVYGSIIIREKGVCGSGDYQQFVTTEKDGESIIRHHIINPDNMASASESIGVTVIADTAELADILATTLFIMGPDAGREFLSTHYPDEPALWFRPDMSVITTDNFPR